MNVFLRDYRASDVRALVIEGSPYTKGVNPRDSRLEYFSRAYDLAFQADLRFNMKTNVLRDNSGWLAKPSNPKEAIPYSREESAFELARAIWCDSVRLYNLANR